MTANAIGYIVLGRPPGAITYMRRPRSGAGKPRKKPVALAVRHKVQRVPGGPFSNFTSATMLAKLAKRELWTELRIVRQDPQESRAGTFISHTTVAEFR
jgi:hypothetical protein